MIETDNYIKFQEIVSLMFSMYQLAELLNSAFRSEMKRSTIPIRRNQNTMPVITGAIWLFKPNQNTSIKKQKIQTFEDDDPGLDKNKVIDTRGAITKLGEMKAPPQDQESLGLWIWQKTI